MKRYSVFTVLLLGIYNFVFAQSTATKIPIWNAGFVENKGQVRDQNFAPEKNVRYVFTDGSSFNLQLKNDGFSYQLFKAVLDKQRLSESGLENYSSSEEEEVPSSLITHRIDVKLVGANPNAQVIASDPSETIFNFYTTGDTKKPILDVHSYSQVIYKNIYPNIDLVFTAPSSSEGCPLKYSWVVRAGGNASDIRLQYNGANGMVKNEDGTVSILASLGKVEEGKLISYTEEDKAGVASSYALHGNIIQYNVEAKAKKPLIIDPNIIWSVDFGGEADEFVSEGDLTLDNKGNTLFTGNTNSTLYIATTGAYQTTFAGGDFDAYLAKLLPAGKLQWATYFGGPDKDEGHAVTFTNNSIYLAGLTHSATGIATPGTHQPVFEGNTDAYLAKFNANGQLQWSTYYGGEGDDQINGLTSDTKGNVYFSGYTTSHLGIATSDAYQDSVSDGDAYYGDAMVGEFHNNSDLEWASYLGGPLTDRAHTISLGNKKELYIEGTCESTTNFAAGAVQQTIYGGGPADAFVARWDTNGKFFWCSYYGGEGDDHGRGVAVDQFDDIYITGWTSSDSAMGTAGSIQPKWYPASMSQPDGFLAKFHPNGKRVWGTYYGGNGKDQFEGLTVDKVNNFVYAAGLTSSTNNISTTGAYQEISAGSSDGMLLKTSISGTRIWGTYVGSGASNKLEDVERDTQGYVYCLMETNGPFPVTPSTNLTKYHGGSETIVIKFSPFDECVDQYEPNETSNTGKKLTPYKDTTLYGYNGSIASGTDQDWFKIKITTSHNLNIVLTDLTMDYDLNFYSPSGQLLLSSTNTGTAGEQIIYNNIPSATYNLQVSHAATQYDPYNCYRLLVMTKDSQWFTKEGDDASDQVMSATDLFAHAVFQQGYFRVNISSAFSAASQITLINTLGQQVYSDDVEINTGTQTVTIPAEKLPPGIYFIRIKTSLNNNVVLKVAIAG